MGVSGACGCGYMGLMDSVRRMLWGWRRGRTKGGRCEYVGSHARVAHNGQQRLLKAAHSTRLLADIS